jgi:transposase InsO family protein
VSERCALMEAEKARTSLVVDALQMSIDTGLVQPQAIFHSDRGCQYTSAEFHRFCKENPNQCRPDRGVPVDNAAAESFFAALKNEMYYRTPGPPEPEHDSPSTNTSKSSTTAKGCTPPSATAPRSKHSPTTNEQQPLPDQTTPRNCPRSLTQPTSFWTKTAEQIVGSLGRLLTRINGGGD